MKGKNAFIWTRLDQVALDIEFLLISVIQGVALGALAAVSVGQIETLNPFALPYIVNAFLLVLIFWSGAIVHALSFIDWPLDLVHNFLYFLASFVEVMAFSQIDSPIKWFIFILLFQIVAGVLYFYDLSMIKTHEGRFGKNEKTKKFFAHMLSQQKKELKTYVPFAIAYSVLSIVLMLIYPETFIARGYHLVLIFGQLVFSLVFMLNVIDNFKKRSKLISSLDSPLD